MMDNSELKRAHAFSAQNGKRLMKGEKCGCFYCLKIFPSNAITRFLKDEGETALCPYCGTDAVLGEHSGFPITEDFLIKMKNFWF